MHRHDWVRPLLATCVVLGCSGIVLAQSQPASETELRAEFLKLCDLACKELNDPARQTPKPIPYYHDSYAVRALCVAYDMTGAERYLQTCQQWADRMIELQKQMTPKGGYYMNYGRKPGEKEGNWYVADNSSIAMGVLATAVRSNGAEKERYLASAKSFGDLVVKNYVGEAGGIMNGFWSKYPGEWWCSSGIFGSFAFLMGRATGEELYRETALGAINWLNHLDWTKTKFEYWKTGEPAVIMYIFEGYSAAVPDLKPSSKLHEEAMLQIQKAMRWTESNQASRGIQIRWDYNTQWGTKLGGIPFHMYALSSLLPPDQRQTVRDAADRELQYIAGVLAKDNPPRLTQLACFAMMSYAERLRPGAIYRCR